MGPNTYSQGIWKTRATYTCEVSHLIAIDSSQKNPARHRQTKPALTDILLMAEILHQLRLVVYPIIYRVSYIPGGARFQPSTVL